MKPPEPKALVKFSLLFVVLLVLYLFGRRWDISLESLREFGAGFSVGLGILVLGGLYAFISVAPIGGRDVVKLVAALLFGWLGSTLSIWLGEILAAAGAFLLARFLGKEMLDRIFGDRLAGMYKKLNRAGFRNVFILRIIPLTPYRLFNFAAGVTDLDFRSYLLGSIAGTFCRTVVMQLIFTAFGDLAAEKGLTVGQILIGSLAFSLIALTFWYFWTRAKQRRSAEAPATAE
jgi:uncharacterized membrane protein YdjX (TVP38/TMEM64 family)